MGSAFFAGLAAIREKRMRPTSLNVFLARLIWFSVVPLVLLAACLAVVHVLTLQSQRDHDAADRARNIMITIDRYIIGQIDGLQLLAASPMIDDPQRWNEYYSEAQGFRRSFGGHVVLAEVSMQMIFNTRVPFGTPLPKLPIPKGRAAAPAALATGRPAVGDMFVGPVAREPLVAVVVPVIRDGQTRYLLVSSIETRRIKQHLDEVALPSGWSLTLYDSTREIIARRSPGEATADSPADEPSSSFTAESAATPWTVVIQVPRSVYRSPILVAAAALAVSILLVTLVSVIGGRLAGRRLARSVAALAGTAAPLASPSTSRPLITEVETVRSLLEESAAAREVAEQTLRHSEQRLRQLFDVAPFPILLGNAAGEIVQSNARFHQTFGYHRDEMPSLSIWWRLACPAPDYRQWVVDTWETAVARARANNEDIEPAELRLTCGNGRDLTVVVSGVVLGDDLLVAFYDISDRKRAEIELQESFREKVALLKEVHHRVKNNLQIVASLLSLQAGRTSNPSVLDVLHDTRNRVRSMALLHEAIYRAGNLAHIDFSVYVKELCTQIVHSSGRAAAGIMVESRVPAFGLAMEQALPCGLIINELVSNSLKHGFPQGRSGRVLVELLHTGEGRLVLKVCDDGVGLPPDLDPSRVSTLGLKLVLNLADQLGGRVVAEQPPGGGAAFTVVFPVPDDIKIPNESQANARSHVAAGAD